VRYALVSDTGGVRHRFESGAVRWCGASARRDRSLVEGEAPLAPREHGEDLASGGLAAEDVAYRLRPRPFRRQAGSTVDLAEQAPVAAGLLEQNHVSTCAWRHGPILERQGTGTLS
jgi:hypothetical protein